MQLEHALPWLALSLTKGIAARLSARLLRQFGSPESRLPRFLAATRRPRQRDPGRELGPNLLIKQGAKLVTSGEDVIEERPTPARAALVKPEQPETAQRDLLVAASLTGSGQKIYALLCSDEPRPIDDIVEHSGLNSSDVLATLFEMEMKGFVRQLPGKLFSKVLL